MLRIEGLSKSFGGLKALKGVTFEIQEGRIHGIIGPNGSGKTTLFNCITGLLPLTEGQIFLEGEKISGLPANAIANKGIRRTFQAGKLVPSLTVEENVMCGIFDFTGKDVKDTFFSHPLKKSKIEMDLRDKAREALDLVGMAGSAFGRIGLAIASFEWTAAVTLVFVGWFLLPRFLKVGSICLAHETP